MPSDLSSSELQEHADASLVPPTPTQVMGDDEISLLDLLIVLAERKRIILLVTAVFAIVAIIISLLLPPRYIATVTLLPPQQGSSMGAALASQLGSMGGMAALAGGSLLKNPNDMYVAMYQVPAQILTINPFIGYSTIPRSSWRYEMFLRFSDGIKRSGASKCK
jgi:hypothetical protein